MHFIAFLGCDGSGKSTVISGLSAELRKSGNEVSLGHWRPNVFSSVPNERALASADDPHGQIPRGLFSSLLKLAWLWLNWWLGWFLSLFRAKSQGYLLFDRYHGDLLVDPIRYRYGGPMRAARLAVRLMPQPDLVIFLDAEPDVLLSRKQEVSREALVASRSRYLALCESNPNCRIVDAAQSLPAVVTDVLSHIRQLT
jgi:thymidylate kinase